MLQLNEMAQNKLNNNIVLKSKRKRKNLKVSFSFTQLDSYVFILLKHEAVSIDSYILNCIEPIRMVFFLTKVKPIKNKLKKLKKKLSTIIVIGVFVFHIVLT